MVKLLEQDVTNRDVLGWKGIHLFHHQLSSCSQKVRIFLNLKGIEWQSHEVDILASENLKPWYLGINPRGLIPAMVHDGEVHIESNDILLYLEALHPHPRLIPDMQNATVRDMLAQEDDLHIDLRNLTFRFMIPRGLPAKTTETLDSYKTGGSGTVNGTADARKSKEIAFWEDYSRQGITDEAVRSSAAKFRARLDGLDQTLRLQPYLLGDAISLVDIAWFVYAHRLSLSGYPIARLHPAVDSWFARLAATPELASEIQIPPPLAALIAEFHEVQHATHSSMSDICGL